MSETKLIYMTIIYLYMILMVISGYWVSLSKNDKEYWHRSIVPILLFTFVHGLRWARDQDYAGYFVRFSNMHDGKNPEDYEYLFFKICDIFNYLGLPFWLFILMESLLFSIAMMYIFKNFKKYLPFIFMLMFYEIRQFDNLIRFYLGFTFFMFSVGALFNNHYKKAIIWVIVACYVHIAFIIFTPLIIFWKWIGKLQFNTAISSVIFIILTFIGGDFLANFQGLDIALNLLGNEKVDFYTNAFEKISTGEFGAGFWQERSLSNNIRLILNYLPGIIWGKEIMKTENPKYGTWIYNIFVIGAITYTFCSCVEILDRINSCLIFFSLFVNSTLVYHISKKRKKINGLKYALIMLALISGTWPAITKVPMRSNDEYMLFLWDANGRDYIPSNIVPMDQVSKKR